MGRTRKAAQVLITSYYLLVIFVQQIKFLYFLYFCYPETREDPALFEKERTYLFF